MGPGNGATAWPIKVKRNRRVNGGGHAGDESYDLRRIHALLTSYGRPVQMMAGKLWLHVSRTRGGNHPDSRVF